MALYQEVVDKLLSIVQNDSGLQEASKILEIKNWCRSYWELLDTSNEEYFNFVAEVFKEEDSWRQSQSSGGDQAVKLNREKIFKALSNAEYTVNNSKNPMHYEDRYQVSCWGCLDHSIKGIFKEMLKGYEVNEDNKNYEKELRGHIKRWLPSPLARFWSHFIYKDSTLIGEWAKEKFSKDGYSEFQDLANKYQDLGEDKYFAIGFEYAANEGKEDAMKFFIDKVPESRRKEILINAAMEQNANPVAISFCLNELGPVQHENLLMESYGENKHSSKILNKLVKKHWFKETIDLLKSWGSIVSEKIKEKKSKQLSEEFKVASNYLYHDYSSFIYGMLDEMTMGKHASSFEEIDNFVCEMLSGPSLKIYKDLFIINTSNKQSTPCRDKMATLLGRDDKESKSVFLILDAAREKNLLQDIISSTEFSLLPYFITDLNTELANKLKSYGVAEPDYNKSYTSLEQSMSATSSSESTVSSPEISRSSETLSYSPNVDLSKNKDLSDY